MRLNQVVICYLPVTTFEHRRSVLLLIEVMTHAILEPRIAINANHRDPWILRCFASKGRPSKPIFEVLETHVCLSFTTLPLVQEIYQDRAKLSIEAESGLSPS